MDLDIQEKIEMKRVIFFIIAVVIIGFLLPGCSYKGAPASSGLQAKGKFDSSAFDYVFIEAIKQKFLGNGGDALKYLEQCIRINPQSDAAYFEMAQIALMLSDRKNAKKFAIKAASINEKNFWYLTLIADIYYQEKIPDSSIMYYEKTVEYFPENENVKRNLANIYSEYGKYDKAAEILNYFERKYGVNETTSVLIVKNLMNSGKYKKAEEKLLELLARSPDEILYNGLLAEVYRDSGEKEKAKYVYNNLLEKDPDNPQILMSLSDFLITERQFDDLFPVLTKVILNDSISRENKIALFSKVISDSSIIKSHSNETELALIVLEADNKADDIILLLRPELYINENNFSQAIMRLEEIISVRPDNYYAWERLLLIYSETKDWTNLFKRGEQCATKFNRSFPAKVLYASAALEKGQLDVAGEELRKAKILAGSDTAKIVQVLVMDADVLYRKKEFTKSFDTFKEAIKISPEDVIILNNYAYYLAEQGQALKEAEKMAKMVIEKEKGNTTFLDTYAWVLYKRGRYKEAEKIMEEIIGRDDKEDAEWYEHLGYIMKALKNCNRAAEYWNIAFQIDNRKSLLLKEIENCGKR